MREIRGNQASVVRPFCSIERSDECETAVSLLGLIIHMICSMRWADALYGHEGRGFSIAGDVHGWLPIAPIHVIPVEKCEAIAAMSFATRLRPETGIRAARTTHRHPRRRYCPLQTILPIRRCHLSERHL